MKKPAIDQYFEMRSTKRCSDIRQTLETEAPPFRLRIATHTMIDLLVYGAGTDSLVTPFTNRLIAVKIADRLTSPY